MDAIGTVINKNGQALAIFQVKPAVIQDAKQTSDYRSQLRRKFKHIPIILLSRIDDEIIFEGEQKDIQKIKEDDLEHYIWKRYINL